jgi:hypothetical protein
MDLIQPYFHPGSYLKMPLAPDGKVLNLEKVLTTTTELIRQRSVAEKMI